MPPSQRVGGAPPPTARRSPPPPVRCPPPSLFPGGGGPPAPFGGAPGGSPADLFVDRFREPARPATTQPAERLTQVAEQAADRARALRRQRRRRDVDGRDA